MRFSARHSGTARSLGAYRASWAYCISMVMAGAILAAIGGCSDSKPKPPKALPARYQTLAPKANVPDFMKGTIYEVAVLENKDPWGVSGYGFAAGPEPAGSNSGTPLVVRDYIASLMVQHGWGAVAANDTFRNLSPGRIIDDPRTAIVEVYGTLPPGARAGQRVDVYVRAATNNQVKSLARMNLWLTDLYDDGVNPLQPNPKGRINAFMKTRGPIFVNPAYVSSGAVTQPGAVANLREGIIMDGGYVIRDRSLNLRLLTPQLSMARAIEARVAQRFEDEATARTQDEGIVFLFVPRKFNGDWQHFMGIVNHLYIAGGMPGTGAGRARELAHEAVKPNALLEDISYCWEGIGPEALPFVQPLYLNPAADVAFAAARAGAMISDFSAEEALLEMARTEGHGFQLNAVKTLGSLPASTRIDRMLSQLLSTSNALVRIEAYRILAQHGAPAIASRKVQNPLSGEDEFIIDQVYCQGPPLIYATRSGVRRIAIFGGRLSLRLPIFFGAMDNRLTISTGPDGRSMVVFDRTNPSKSAGVRASTGPELMDLLWRLAGGSNEGFRFGYAELVGIVQSLSAGRHIDGTFVLQDLPAMQATIEEAPPIIEPAASQTDPLTAEQIKQANTLSAESDKQ